MHARFLNVTGGQKCDIPIYLLCKEINLERSVALWSLLINKMQQQGAYFFRLSLEGEYKYIEKYKQDFTIETFYNTIAYNQLFTQKWIYNKKGELSTIKDIKNSEDLNDKYDFSLPDLFFFFGISNDNSLSKLDKEQRSYVSLIKKFENLGISKTMLVTILHDKIKSEEL